MASPVIQYAKNAAGGVTSISVTLNNVVSGDTLWVGMECGGSESLTVTDSAGTLTTAALDNTTAPLHGQFAGFSAAAGTHTFTATLGTARTCAIFAAELDPAQAASLDGAPFTPNAGSSITVTTNTATPSTSGDLAIAFVNLQSGQTNPWAAGLTNGYTAVDSGVGTTANGIWGYLTGVSAATSSGITIPAADNWNASVILFKAASGAGGTAAITEASDTVSATGNIAIPGTASITEASDTVSATGALSVAGTAAITEGSDTVAATGVGGEVGTAAITESSDTVSATGTLSVTGSATITEQPDATAATGGITLSGAASIFEGGDIVVASGALGLAGSASITEAPDSVAATGSGPQPANPMPNFIGFPINYVIQILAAQGLAASLTYQIADPPGTTMGLITAQSPAPGQQLKAPVSFTCTGAIALPAVGVRSGNVPALLVGNNDNPGGRSTNS